MGLSLGRDSGKNVPELVGGWGNPREFRMQGNEEISRDEIESALLTSSEFILASHPQAEFSGFLETTQNALERAYQNVGFEDPLVKVFWDQATEEVALELVEGPRYRSGRIRLSGNALVSEAFLKERLLIPKEGEEATVLRADAAYRTILEEKKMPTEMIEAAFPDAVGEDESKESKAFAAAVKAVTSEVDGVWETGNWVGFLPSELEEARNRVRASYAEMGRVGLQFELKVISDPTQKGIADLVIKISSEGEAARLGKIELVGNRVNTREGFLAYLALEEGMELKGPWIDRMNRRLFSSGRFVGWSVLPKLSNQTPGQVDLQILVVEEWEAPPLSSPLSPEQTALLKLADWLNTRVGDDGDLVVRFEFEAKGGRSQLEFVYLPTELVLSWEGPELQGMIVIPVSGPLEILWQAGGRSFYSSSPAEADFFRGNFRLIASPKADPLERSGRMDFSLGLGNSSDETDLGLKLLMDPAVAIRLHRKGAGIVPQLLGDELVIGTKGNQFRFEAGTGKFRSFLKTDDDGAVMISGRIEKGAAQKARKRLRERAEGLANWGAENSAWALPYLIGFFAGELNEVFKEDEIRELPLSDVIGRAADGTGKWFPLAGFLGKVSTAVQEQLFAGDDEKPFDDRFKVPLRREFAEEAMRTGSLSSMVVSMALFDSFADTFESGSWPERVMRELLFVMDGNTRYLPMTLKVLLKDQSIGPGGCLLCAQLLELINHPASGLFLKKGERELSPEGFAKDWKLLLKGKAGEDGLGWEILKAFRELRRKDLEGFFVGQESPLMTALLNLAEKTSSLNPEVQAEVLAPAMKALWTNGVGEWMGQKIAEAKSAPRRQYDPEYLAALINGDIPVFTNGVRLSALLAKDKPNRLGLSPLDTEIVHTLAAIDFQKREGTLTEAAYHRFLETTMETVGDNKSIKQLGFTSEEFRRWTGILASAKLRFEEVLGDGEISEEEAREFYHKDRFLGGLKERLLYTIMIKADGDGTAEKKRGEEILKRIREAGKGGAKARREAFQKEAREHSEDSFQTDGGNRGWILESDLSAPMRNPLMNLEDEALSGLLDFSFGEERYYVLMLVPEARRKASFDTIKDRAALGVYRAKLLKEVKIEVIAKPDPEEAEAGMAEFFNRLLILIGADVAEEEEDAEREAWDEVRSPEEVWKRAMAGEPLFIYRLGTYAERGLSSEENGMDVAVGLYQKAAAEGSLLAMMRLSELYRLGRGVEQDGAKARSWYEKALAASQEE